MQGIQFIATYADSTGNLDSARCWDHFAPSAPLGLPFAQTYRNCNGRDVRVWMGVVSGGVFDPDTTCGLVRNGETTVIVRTAPYRFGQYTTRVC